MFSTKLLKLQLKKNKGFSLIEVLITLVLISLIFAVFSSNLVTSTPREELERFNAKLEGAIHFCIDESILKNKIIRLRFLLEKTPQEYLVEEANNNEFIRSKKNKTKKNDFSKISEFEDGNQTFPDELEIIAVGDSNNEAMIYDGSASIYFYPNGSRDRSIIIVNNSEEISILNIPAFLKSFSKKYIKIEQSSSQTERDDVLLEQAKTIFTQWLKK